MAALGPLLLGNASSQPLLLILTWQSRAQLSDEELSLSEFNQRTKSNFSHFYNHRARLVKFYYDYVLFVLFKN